MKKDATNLNHPAIIIGLVILVIAGGYVIYNSRILSETLPQNHPENLKPAFQPTPAIPVPAQSSGPGVTKNESQCDPQSAGSRTLIPVDTSVPIQDPVPGIRYSLNESDSDRTLVLTKGDVIEINLQINPGLGLHWVVPVSGCALELTNDGAFSHEGDFWNVTTYYRARYRAVGYGTSVISGRRILSDEREGDPRFNLTVIVK
jgi:hypothetical protein